MTLNPDIEVADFYKNITIFIDLTFQLGLPDVRYTYLLYLWFKYLRINSYERVQDGGDEKLGALSKLGSNAME